MNCKSHVHLGKFNNFLVCTYLKIQDFCIFPIRLQTNSNGEICLDRQQTNAGRAWYNYWSRNIMSFVLYTQILKQSVLKPASPGITLKALW